jgi:sterol desaturase/sphingolipid hydroxylase (fatty acid hydroxylase superfamily)
MYNISESSIRLLLFFTAIIFFLAMELILPYRASSVSKLKRWINNIALALFNSLLLQLVFSSAVASTAVYVQSHRLGVLNMVEIPLWLKVFVTVVFLDFMLYLWHLLNHEMPTLWRFHRVHHSDLNMDVSTATRFHFGELAISAVIKISIIFFLGASTLAVLVFESLLVLCAQFEHSSLKVSKWFEAIYWIFFVPPSMHRIHHSVIINERNTNYGTIFSLWDRILGTLLSNVNQDDIRIGVGAYRRPDKLNFHQLLAMPFTRPIR